MNDYALYLFSFAGVAVVLVFAMAQNKKEYKSAAKKASESTNQAFENQKEMIALLKSIDQSLKEKKS